MKNKILSQNAFTFLFAFLFSAQTALAYVAHPGNPVRPGPGREAPEDRPPPRDSDHKPIAKGEKFDSPHGRHAMNMVELKNAFPDIEILIDKSTGRVELEGIMPTACKKFFVIEAVRSIKGRELGFRISDEGKLGQKCLRPFHNKSCREIGCTRLSQIPSAHFYLGESGIRGKQFVFHVGGMGANFHWSDEGLVPVRMLNKRETAHVAERDPRRFDEIPQTHTQVASQRPSIIYEDIYVTSPQQGASRPCGSCQQSQQQRPVQIVQVPTNSGGGCNSCQQRGSAMQQIPVMQTPQLMNYPSMMNSGCSSCQMRSSPTQMPAYAYNTQRMPSIMPMQQYQYRMPTMMPSYANSGCSSCQMRSNPYQNMQTMPSYQVMPTNMMSPNYNATPSYMLPNYTNSSNYLNPNYINRPRNSFSFGLGFSWT